jgi:hypothetical protein
MARAPEPHALDGRQLNGWKEIAAHLGKSVRSVQRWELTLGLPVHRIRTPDGIIIYADSEEIDSWKRGLDIPRALTEKTNGGNEASETEPSPVRQPAAVLRVPYVWMLLAAVAIGASVLGYALGRARQDQGGVAVEVRYVGRTIEAIARNGRVAWSYPLNADVVAPRNQPVLFLDFEGDGETEILVPVQSASHGTQPGLSDAVYCFSRRGELKWMYAPDYSLSFDDQRFTAPWEIMDIAVSSGGPTRRIWVAFAHHTWWPGFVVEIGAAGQPHLVFAQAGRIFSVSHWTTASGGMLAIGGAVNTLRSATLMLIPDTGAVASYPMQGSKPPCELCPVGDPRRVFLFDTSELTRANHEGFPYVNAIRPVGPALKLMITEGGGSSIVMLNNDFSIDSFQFSDRYWAAHRAFEKQGRIDHAAELCPDRERPREVREWTAERGWYRQSITPGNAGARTLEP